MKATHETARPDRAAAGRAPGEEGVLRRPPPRLHGNVMVSGLIPSGRQLTLAAIRTQRGEGPMFGYGWCGGMGAGGWVLRAVLWGGFLAVVVWAVQRQRDNPARTGADAAPRHPGPGSGAPA